MGIFGFNYSKPGPGISKDAPDKKGIFRYFEMFFRKFWKLLQVNMLSFVTSLPFIAIMFFLSPTDGLIDMAYGEVNDETAIISVLIRAMFAIMMYILFGSGPVSASYAYITRCFTRGEHAWIFSDFKDKFIENFKQGIIVSVIDIVFVALISLAYSVYYSQYLATGSILWFVLLAFLTVTTFFYIITHFYVYQFMVTFESKTTQMYKNAFIFAAAHLPMCVFLLVFAAAVNFLMFTYIPNPMLIILFDFLIGISLVRFPIEYSASRAISKTLLSSADKNDYASEDERAFSDETEFKGDE